ncbi:hypothetical protein ABE10_12235, partial [Bacillus toyonensis]|nr:hypothetical protein [Bacillus toyonensis]
DVAVVDRLDLVLGESGTLVRFLDLCRCRVLDVMQRVVLMGVGRNDLRLRQRLETVLEEPTGERGTEVLVPGDASLGVRADHERLVGLVVDELPPVVLVDRLVDLDELTAGEAHDPAGLIAVQDDLTILLLQRDADALGDEVPEHRADEQQGLERVDHAFHGQHEVSGDEVGRGSGPQHGVEDHTRHADRGACRCGARTLSDVVLALVAGDPRLDEGVERDEDDEDPQHGDRQQDPERPCVIEEDDVEVRRRQTQRAVREADVPVRLGAGRHGGGVVRAVVPDRVDLEERGDQHDHAEGDEQEAAHLRHVHRHHRVADDVAVRAAGAGELGVLVDHHEHQVQHDEGEDQCREQQDVQRVQASDDLGAGELAAEQEERGPGADQRDALDHSVDDAEAVAGEQVVGERVPGEALGHGQDEQDEPDDPVQLTRLAERAGEEHAQHVDADPGDEHERRPVMDLTDQKAAAQVE